MPSGSVDIRLVNEPVRYVAIGEFPSECGGECAFLGRTRAETHPKHGALLRLSYEAYRPMALQVLHDLAAEAGERFGCDFTRIHHALGIVPVGEASVLVQTAGVRRAAAFDACRFLIDRLKSSAPIWKREEWADGATWSTGTPVNVERSA